MELKQIYEVSDYMGIDRKYVEPYGGFMAKISLEALKEIKRKSSKLILVTAITPTPAGEGKTTTSIGLSMAINKLGYKSVLAIRQPSLGPILE
jgi:Formate-tetrahydrofolate ligase (EC 6.3.4.3)